MMAEPLRHTSEDIAKIYNRHVINVYRVCFTFMKNGPDTEDAVQNTFIRLIEGGQAFHDFEHEKAWLIVTASNICKDQLSHWWRKNIPLDEDVGVRHEPFEIDETINVIMALPKKYKVPIYLYYYEGYKGREIAEMLRLSSSTVRSLLKRGRAILRRKIENDEQIEGDRNEE